MFGFADGPCMQSSRPHFAWHTHPHPHTDTKSAHTRMGMLSHVHAKHMHTHVVFVGVPCILAAGLRSPNTQTHRHTICTHMNGHQVTCTCANMLCSWERHACSAAGLTKCHRTHKHVQPHAYTACATAALSACSTHKHTATLYSHAHTACSPTAVQPCSTTEVLLV